MILQSLIYVFVFLFGLCAGSFLNCVIYRLEKKKSLKGRSFCPQCKHALDWNDLFPIFSFLFLKGKCRYCKVKISIQYPLVELATGMIFLLIFNKFSVIPSLTGNPEASQALWIPAFAGMTVYLVFLFYIASALIIIFVYDFKHYLIPDKVLLPAIAVSLVYRLIYFTGLFSAQGKPASGWNFLVAAIIAAGFFLAIFLFSAGKWMGFGDVKLAVLMGLLLGLPNVLVALFFAFLFGAIVGLALIWLQKKGLKSEIPFGPFLIAGTFIALFWGTQVINWYISLIS